MISHLLLLATLCMIKFLYNIYPAILTATIITLKSTPFHAAVDGTIVTDYYQIVTNPIDLGIIQKVK